MAQFYHWPVSPELSLMAVGYLPCCLFLGKEKQESSLSREAGFGKQWDMPIGEYL